MQFVRRNEETYYKHRHTHTFHSGQWRFSHMWAKLFTQLFVINDMIRYMYWCISCLSINSVFIPAATDGQGRLRKYYLLSPCTLIRKCYKYTTHTHTHTHQCTLRHTANQIIYTYKYNLKKMYYVVGVSFLLRNKRNSNVGFTSSCSCTAIIALS